jgi:hypothetical protein
LKLAALEKGKNSPVLLFEARGVKKGKNSQVLLLKARGVGKREKQSGPPF